MHRFSSVAALVLSAVLLAAAAGCGGPMAETAGVTPPPAFQQAEAAYQRGDLASAREGFRTFAHRQPKHAFAPWAYYWQGKIDLKQERYAEALYAFKRALDMRPEPLIRGPLLMALGDAEYNRREYRKALGYYRQVDSGGFAGTVRQDELYFKTALALQRTGDRTQADRYFDRVELFPGSPYIEEARRRSGRDSPVAPTLHYLGLGTFTRWDGAERVRKEASAAGFQANIERVTSAAGVLYEVRVPVVGGREEISAVENALRGKGFRPVASFE